MIRFSAALLACSLSLPPLGAQAACQARGDLVCGGAPSISSSGELQVSRGGGYAPLAAGRTLGAGDRILSGRNAATLSLGSSCSTTVKAGSLVTLSKSGEQTCARISQAGGGTGAGAGSAAATGGVGATGAVIGLAGAAGLGVALATTGGGKDKTVSAR